eukprot:g7186.t1
MAYYTTTERSVPGTARSDQRGSYFGMYSTPKFAPPTQSSYMEQTMSVIVEDEPEAINARLFASAAKETPKPASTRRRRASLLPSKEGRVKVAIRCRPPFEDELEESGDFFPIVNCPKGEETPRVELFLGGKSRRNFYYDHVFGPDAEQLDVYDNVAGPIVHGALNGLNGAIFAYGQTGTGKTYTMGILDELEETSLGIIPRSLRHVFGHIDANSEASKWTVTVSFLQIYLENVQDLLATNDGQTPMSVDNEDEKPLLGTSLKIRENPKQGFYVEGLQKYIVESVEETVELINFGLRNRVMAPTLMNTTSSRSHTVLTLEIEHADLGNNNNNGGRYRRILKGKLLLVDLAGSERVRRTTSQGARLEEAKAINQSLSALGNVVAALADPNAPHIPFRDSNLTKLAQDSLGGNANTALIATIGPALENNSETLSTLMFASRCMRLRSEPVKNEEVDYAQMVSALQNQLAGAVQQQKERESAQQDHYEEIIHQLNLKIESLQVSTSNNNSSATTINIGKNDDVPEFDVHGAMATYGSDLVKMIYETIRQMVVETSILLSICCQEELRNKERWANEQNIRIQNENSRSNEIIRMAQNDPLGKSSSLGPHLKVLGRDEAFSRVERRYGTTAFFSNDNRPSTSALSPSYDPALARSILQRYLQFAKENLNATYDQLVLMYTFPMFDEAIQNNNVEAHLSRMRIRVQENLQAIYLWTTRRNSQIVEAREQIAVQLVEQRQREEEVVNWSYVLKHLLATNSSLKKEVNDLKRNQTQKFREHIIQQQRNVEYNEHRNKNSQNKIDLDNIPKLTVDLNFDEGGGLLEQEALHAQHHQQPLKHQNANVNTVGPKKKLTERQKHVRKIASLRAKAAEERKRYMALEKAREEKFSKTKGLSALSWVRRGQGAAILREVNDWENNNYIDKGLGSTNTAKHGADIMKQSINLIQSFWSTTGEYLLYGDTHLMTAAKLQEERDKKKRLEGRGVAAMGQMSNLKLSKTAQQTYSQLDTYMKTLSEEQQSLQSKSGKAYSQMDRYLEAQQQYARQAQKAGVYTKEKGTQGLKLKEQMAKKIQTPTVFNNERESDSGATMPMKGNSVKDRVKGWENKVGSVGTSIKEDSISHFKQSVEEIVQPFVPRGVTVESLTEIGGGGWLLRKRPELKGHWDVMYVTFKKGQIISYIVLSQKGSVELHDAIVTDDIPKEYFSNDERRANPYSFGVFTKELSDPLILSAPNESAKQEWIHALKATIQKSKEKVDSRRSLKRRRSLIETVLSDGVILEGILMKKARSAKVFKNWKVRIFKLQRDTLTLDYFDVKVYDKISCHGTYSTPTVMSAHREAVDNDINPIWFQKKCKYTFQCYEHSDTSHLFNNGSELKNHDGGNVSSGVDDDKKTVLAEYGTEYEEHRSTWVKALMKFNDVDVA